MVPLPPLIGCHHIAGHTVYMAGKGLTTADVEAAENDVNSSLASRIISIDSP
jgi:hypothetical protein